MSRLSSDGVASMIAAHAAPVERPTELRTGAEDGSPQCGWGVEARIGALLGGSVTAAHIAPSALLRMCRGDSRLHAAGFVVHKSNNRWPRDCTSVHGIV